MDKNIKLVLGYIFRVMVGTLIVMWDIRVMPIVGMIFPTRGENAFVTLCLFLGMIQIAELVFMANFGMSKEVPLENKLFLRPLILVPAIAASSYFLFPYINLW